MFNFGVKDIIDIFLFALLLYYVYRLMKESGTINIFYGVLSFIVVWVLCSEIFEMRLIGTILDKFMAIGLIILVILFQEPIKQRRWRRQCAVVGYADCVCLHEHEQEPHRCAHCDRAKCSAG